MTWYRKGRLAGAEFSAATFQSGSRLTRQEGSGPLEIALSARVGFLSLLLLSFPVLSQQSTMSQPVPGGNWAPAPPRPKPPPLNSQEFRLQAINHDAADQSALSGSMQPDLSSHEKRMLSKDLKRNPTREGARGSQPIKSCHTRRAL